MKKKFFETSAQCARILIEKVRSLPLNISIFDGCRNQTKHFSNAKLSQKFKKVISWSDQALDFGLEAFFQHEFSLFCQFFDDFLMIFVKTAKIHGGKLSLAQNLRPGRSN